MPYYPPAASGTSLPVADTTALVKGSSDPTKLLQFEVDGFTAGQTRTITVPNVSSTMAVLTTNQTFTGTQTFSAVVAVSATLSAFLAQGDMRVTGGIVSNSCENLVAAAGTTQGAATTLTRQNNRVTSATGGVADGVKLFAGVGPNTAGMAGVVNDSGATVKVYPYSGGQIDSLATDAAYSLPSGARAFFVPVTDTLWISFRAFDAAAGALLAASNLSDLASASAARTNLGLGTAATQNTGTSGANIGLLNGNNTYSGNNTHSGTLTITNAVDVSWGGTTLKAGADNGASSRTDATTKVMRFVVPHYTNSEEPIGVIVAFGGSSANTLIFGGGSSAVNAATAIQFCTGATSTTVDGTVRLQLDSSGDATWGEGTDFILGTSTGTKIGTATGQKLGFWNATPVVQQVLATGAGATVDNVISLLQTLGLCKQS